MLNRNCGWGGSEGWCIDVDAMKKAASYLVGKHDFRSFCGNNKMKKSTVRTIYDVGDSQEGDYVRMRFHGNGFLQNMVRILTGTLVEIGYGHMDAEHMPEIIAGWTGSLPGLRLRHMDYVCLRLSMIEMAAGLLKHRLGEI